MPVVAHRCQIAKSTSSVFLTPGERVEVACDPVNQRVNPRIAALQRRLHRASRDQSLFVVRWSVV